MPDFTIRLINGEDALAALVQRLEVSPALALDIETVNWWNREAERVALIQLAFRESARLRVAVINALADFDLAPLRAPLELSGVTKAVHNIAELCERGFVRITVGRRMEATESGALRWQQVKPS